MYMLIGYSDTSVIEAILLKSGRNTMRVAVAGESDARELLRIGSQWFMDDGEAVEFQFLTCARGAESPEREPAAVRRAAC